MQLFDETAALPYDKTPWDSRAQGHLGNGVAGALCGFELWVCRGSLAA